MPAQPTSASPAANDKEDQHLQLMYWVCGQLEHFDGSKKKKSTNYSGCGFLAAGEWRGEREGGR